MDYFFKIYLKFNLIRKIHIKKAPETGAFCF